MSDDKTADQAELNGIVAGYLAEKLDAKGPVVIDGMTQIAVGWSHETWLFDARWTDADGEQTRGLCLRRDPGNALLRETSDLGHQFKVLRCLEATDVPAPKVYWYEPEPAALGAPALIMERVPGECPSPWRRAGREFYAAAAERSRAPSHPGDGRRNDTPQSRRPSSPTPSPPFIPPTGKGSASTSSVSPKGARGSPSARSPSGRNWSPTRLTRVIRSWPI